MGLLVGEYRIVIEIYFTTGYCDNAVERTLYVGMSDQTQSQWIDFRSTNVICEVHYKKVMITVPNIYE